MTRWRKSSYSCDTANCVEFSGTTPERIGVRDSKDPDGPVLWFEPQAWRDFIAAIQADEI